MHMYILVQFGNNWIQNVPLIVKLIVQVSSNTGSPLNIVSLHYFQIGQHLVNYINILCTNGSYIDSTVMNGMASQALQLKRSHQKKRKKIWMTLTMMRYTHMYANKLTGYRLSLISRTQALKRNLQFQLHFRQTALKFCLLWASFQLTLILIWSKTRLDPCQSGK